VTPRSGARTVPAREGKGSFQGRGNILLNVKGRGAKGSRRGWKICLEGSRCREKEKERESFEGGGSHPKKARRGKSLEKAISSRDRLSRDPREGSNVSTGKRDCAEKHYGEARELSASMLSSHRRKEKRSQKKT